MARTFTCWRLRWMFFGLVGVLLCLSGSSVVAARGKVQVAYVFLRSGSDVSDVHYFWTFRLTRWAFRRQSRLVALGPKAIKKRLRQGAGSTSKQRAQFKAAQKYFEKGKVLYEDRNKVLGERRFLFSLRALNKAGKIAEKQRSWMTDPKLIRDIYLYKALNYMGMRKGNEARAYMLQAIRLDPWHNIEEDGLPQRVTDYYKLLHKWLMKRAHYQLVVRSVPKGARIYLNMRSMGKASKIIKNLPPGEYVLRLTHPGYFTWRKKITIDPKKLQGKKRLMPPLMVLRNNPKALTFVGLPVFARGASVDAVVLDRLEALRKKLKVPYIYVFQPQRGSKKRGHILRAAFYRKGLRTISYTNIRTGRSRYSHRMAILKFLRAENNRLQLTPP